MERPNFNNEPKEITKVPEKPSVVGKIGKVIRAGAFVAAAAVASAPQDTEARVFLKHERVESRELLKSIVLDTSAKEFFDENSLSLRSMKNPTKEPGETAVCIATRGIFIIDICILEATKSTAISYDRKARKLLVNIVNKDGSLEEHKLSPKFNEDGLVIDFF